jgi:phage tail sheath gpL-like
MSQISFELIPNNWRVPGAYAEINNSFAIQGLVGQPYTVLIIGQMLSTGTATALEPMQVTNVNQANDYYGAGSMLAKMVARYKDNDQSTKTVCIGVEDDTSAAAAEGSITFTGTATQAGTIELYIAGTRIKAGVSAGDNATAIATAVNTAIATNSLVPVTSSVAAGKVTLTAKHKGENGNAIDVRFNYYTGQKIPAGVTTAITLMNGGATNPEISSVITAMGDTWYNTIVMPWTDAANLTALEQELSDRYGPMKAIDGIAIAAHRSNHAGLTTLGQSRNNPHCSVFESNGYPINPEERAAMLTARISFAAQNDPARPFQTLSLKDDMPPKESDRFTMYERNLLLFDGISTTTVDAGGVVRIERAITTYTENQFGGPDPSYLDINTLFTLSYLRYTWRARLVQK